MPAVPRRVRLRGDGYPFRSPDALWRARRAAGAPKIGSRLVVARRTSRWLLGGGSGRLGPDRTRRGFAGPKPGD
jgi:hypothetical protein